jgi:molecular chaperone Hsp33
VQLAGGAADARLAITLDPRGGTMYQGIVALAGSSIAESIEHYLTASEQLASRLVLGVHDGDAFGLLLQRLPSSTVDDDAVWQRAQARLADAPAALRAAPDALALLHMLFPQDDVRVFPARRVRFRCRCTQGRAENALRIAGRAEVEAALAAQGQVDVTCEYCGRRYAFDRAAALALFAPPVAGTH